MPRPESVTDKDLIRWSTRIESDPLMGSAIMQSPIIKEVCYAGLWLVEKLTALDCPTQLIGQITYTAGKICFGREDPWEIHQDILSRYVDGTLIFDAEPDKETN